MNEPALYGLYGLQLLVTLAVKSALLLGLVWCAVALLRRQSARLRHAVWTAGFAGLVLLLPLSFAPTRWGVAAETIAPRPSAPARVVLGESGALPAAAPVAVRTESATLPAPGPLPTVEAPPAVPRQVPGPWLWALAVWGGGALLLLLRGIVELVSLTRLARRAEPLPLAMASLVEPCRRRIGLPRAPVVRVSDDVGVPLVCGLVRPVVLLPRSAAAWSREELTDVLLHEMAHVRRRDPWANLLVHVAHLCFWPQPLVWFAARRSHLTRELACDEQVLGAGSDRFDYAEHLVSLAGKLGPARAARLAMAPRTALRDRLISALDYAPGRPALDRKRGGLLAAGLTGLLLLLGSTGLVTATREATVAAEDDRTNWEWTRQLGAGSKPERLEAAWTLGMLEARDAARALERALATHDGDLRGMAAWALGEIKDERSVEPLVRALDHPDPLTREMVAKALGELETEASVAALTALAGDDVPAVRAAAVWALGEVGTRGALDGAARGLDDRDPAVRAMAVRILGTRRPGQAAGALRGALDDASAVVRAEAARQLATAGDGETVRALVAVLDDADPTVRMHAVQSLGEIGDSAAIPRLMTALRDPDADVRAWVVWALDEI